MEGLISKGAYNQKRKSASKQNTSFISEGHIKSNLQLHFKESKEGVLISRVVDKTVTPSPWTNPMTTWTMPVKFID